MFLRFYGLREQPFGVTPDPAYLYFSATHREALASLFYGIESGCGFLALIAQPGMGKTTLLFHLLEKLRDSAQTVYIFQTQCGSREFFRYLLVDLGADSGEQDLARMHEALNAALLKCARMGRRVVLVVDEAQNLDASVLETVRLLSDFETPRSKLLQIVLCGQPQLADKLAHPTLTQLRQRISIIGRLHPLTRVETMVYIEYRLCKAGYSGPPLFGFDAVELIASHSGGIPRNINNLCFNALTLGCAKQAKKIDASIILEVLADLDLEKLGNLSPTTGLVPEDSLSSFDGVSPDDDETYRQLHEAVRTAWGAESKASSPEHTKKDSISLQSAQNSVQMSFSQEPPVSESNTPDEVDEVSEPPLSPKESEPAAPTLFPELTESAAAPAKASVREHPPHDPQSELQPAAKKTEGIEVAVPHRGVQLSAPSESSGGTWKWFLPGRMRRRKGITGERRLTASSAVILALVVLVGAEFLLLARHRFQKASDGTAPAHKTETVLPNSNSMEPESSLTPAAVEVPADQAKETEETRNTKEVKEASPLLQPEESNIVTIEPGETLGGVSLRYLGQASPHAIQQIQGLNPRIKNPDLIFSGMKIHLPPPANNSSPSTLSTEGNASPTEGPR